MNELSIYYVYKVLIFLFYICEFSSGYFNKFSARTHIFNS